ncbi:hypothetical protein AB0K48_56290, partial [Nonomuraea sp. NPDC055795]
VVREPFLNEGHYPFIHEDDLAAVALAALRTGDHVGTVVEAVGRPPRTYDDWAGENAGRFR